MKAIEGLLLTYLANAVWMACLVASAAKLLSRLIRQCPSAYRHVLWVMALIFATVLPLTSLRTHRLSAPDAWVGGAEGVAASASAPSARSASESFWVRMRSGRQPIPFAPLLSEIVAAGYLGFVVLRGLALGRALRRTRRILHGARTPSFSPCQMAVVRRCLASAGAGRLAIFCSSELEGGPVVLGIRRPALILPEWFSSNISEEEITSALGHELAHVRRHDFLANLVYEVVLLPVSFHPAALFIKAQIEQSRELACDEFAAGSLPTPAAYARSLVSMAQSIAGQTSPIRSSYALGLFDAHTLEARVMNLIDTTKRPNCARSRAQALIAAAILAAACLTASAFSVQVAHPSRGTDELKQFAGTWEGKFKGKTFVTLKLAAKDGKLSGTVSRFNIEMGGDGELTEASTVDGEDLVVETSPKGRVLHLTTQSKGRVDSGGAESEESIEYEMRLTAKDQAELHVAGAPPGGPSPKPWKLERTSP